MPASRRSSWSISACPGFGLIERPSIPQLAPARARRRTTTSRPVYFDGAFRDTPVYQRATLAARAAPRGPAVIEEFGSTTVVFPGQSLEVDPHGILIIRPVSKPLEVVR